MSDRVVMSAASVRALPEPDYEAWLDWLRRVGVDEVGYCDIVEILDSTTALVEFYADEQGLPTREVEGIYVEPGADHAERVWATMAISEPPPRPLAAV